MLLAAIAIGVTKLVWYQPTPKFSIWTNRRRWPHSPRLLTSRMRCSSAVILLAGLPLVRSLAYISYRLLVYHHSPRWPTSRTRCSFGVIFADLGSNVWQKRRVRHCWPTSRTHCSSALILLAGLPLVRLLATAPTRCSFGLISADLRSNVWQKRRVRHH